METEKENNKELKLHWSPENFGKALVRIEDRIREAKAERGNLISEYMRQNGYIKREGNVPIEIEIEYEDKGTGTRSVHFMPYVYFNEYVVLPGGGNDRFFREFTVVPMVRVPEEGTCFRPDMSMIFPISSFAGMDAVEIRYRELGGRKYYKSTGGNFEEVEMDSEESRWCSGEGKETDFLEIYACGTEDGLKMEPMEIETEQDYGN